MDNRNLGFNRAAEEYLKVHGFHARCPIVEKIDPHRSPARFGPPFYPNDDKWYNRLICKLFGIH